MKLIIGVNDLATLYPQLVPEWDYEKNGKGPEQYTICSKLKASWICSKCGEHWTAYIYNRTRNGSNCPYCSGRYPRVGINDFKTHFPTVASEWDYEKNEKTPQYYTVFSNIPVWWKCPKCKQSWKVSISHRSLGSNCPYCAGEKPIVGKTDLASVNPKLAADWDYEKNKKKPQDYAANSNVSVWWKCPVCLMSWKTTIYHRSKGSGCPYCSDRYPIPGKTDLASLNPKLAADWDYEKNSKGPQDYTVSSGKRAWWKCRKCGQGWDAIIASRNHGSGCPYCAGQKPIVGKSDLASVNPKLASDWDYEKNEKTPQDYTVNSTKKAWWKCKTCGQSWLASIEKRTRGKGCPYCSGRYPIVGKTDFATTYPDLTKEWDYSRNKKGPQAYKPKSGKKVWWICTKCGHNWFATISSRASGNGCPRCKKNKRHKYD